MTEVHAIFGPRRSGKTFAAAAAINQLIAREGAVRVLLTSPVQQNRALMFRALYDTALGNNVPTFKEGFSQVDWPSGAKAKYLPRGDDLRGMYANYLWLDGQALLEDFMRNIYHSHLDRTLQKVIISGDEPDEQGAYWLIKEKNLLPELPYNIHLI